VVHDVKPSRNTDKSSVFLILNELMTRFIGLAGSF
ncbi:uncharacterized protein METZ01_LOCUS462317, partial [marine metagenome]